MAKSKKQPTAAIPAPQANSRSPELDQSPKNAKKAKAAPTSGRLVWNHSTHLDGLIPILEKLTQVTGISTITPAVLSHGRSNSPQLQLKVSVPIRGGYKLIARKGKTIQEVFVITDLSAEELKQAIEQIVTR